MFLHICVVVTGLVLVVDHLYLDSKHMIFVTVEIVSFMLLNNGCMQGVKLCDHILHLIIDIENVLALFLIVLH